MTKVCMIEDCSRPLYGRGWCATHWRRWQRNGHPLALQRRLTVAERFEASVVESDEGCWAWIKNRTPAGYGLISVGNKYQLAHRWAYEAFVRPIPEGMHLDHLCRNRGCVNPKHLDVVTNRENVLRGMSPAAVIHRQGVCRRGHLMVGDNVYVPPKKPTQRICRACKQYRRDQMRAAGRRVT